MKKTLKYLLILSLSMLLFSCSSTTDTNTVSGADTTTTDTTTNTTSETTVDPNVANADTTANTSTDTTSDTSATTASDTSTQTFTLDDLKLYDGQDGNPAYVAYEGIVYDVTNADKWKDGKHESGIVAGIDLTDLMSDSPHGVRVLENIPVVGTLE